MKQKQVDGNFTYPKQLAKNPKNYFTDSTARFAHGEEFIVSSE